MIFGNHTRLFINDMIIVQDNRIHTHQLGGFSDIMLSQGYWISK